MRNCNKKRLKCKFEIDLIINSQQNEAREEDMKR